jgi:hypothetical protein
MERRRKAASHPSESRVEKLAADTQQPTHATLPNIAELIDFGGITVGQMELVGCVAIANSEDGCLAMLRRRKNETLTGLLIRLDQAIAKAMNEDIYTDEINTTIK